MARLTWVLLLWVGSCATASAANELMRANFLNAYYCAGIADIYGERLSAAGGHAGEAGKAKELANILRSRAAQIGRSHQLSGGEKAAEANGKNTMSRLLPPNGGWTKGGDIPIDAVRQYQQCVSMVQR